MVIVVQCELDHGPDWWVFSAIPHLELDITLLPKGLVLGQISVLVGKWLVRRQKDKQASLMLLMLAWACPLMLLMLAWACRFHMSPHDCQSLSGKEFICWIKAALRDMLDENCSRQCCSLHVLSAATRACSCRFITASVWARVSLALGEKLVLKLFHCVKFSAYGLPLWNSHAVMTLQALVCNGSISDKQAQTWHLSVSLFVLGELDPGPPFERRLN